MESWSFPPLHWSNGVELCSFPTMFHVHPKSYLTRSNPEGTSRQRFALSKSAIALQRHTRISPFLQEFGPSVRQDQILHALFCLIKGGRIETPREFSPLEQLCQYLSIHQYQKMQQCGSSVERIIEQVLDYEGAIRDRAPLGYLRVIRIPGKLLTYDNLAKGDNLAKEDGSSTRFLFDKTVGLSESFECVPDALSCQ